MVSSIGGSVLAQSVPAPAASRASQEVQAAGAQGTASAASAATSAAAGGGDADSTAVTRSALSSATDRLGEQLNAQADAARLRQAGGEEEAAEAAGTGEATVSASADTESAGSAGPAGTAAQAAGGAGVAGGAGGAGGASSGSSESSDYIAEADTNSDRKVSDEERAAYEKKLAAQAGKNAEAPQAGALAEGSRAQEVRQAYNPQDSEPSLDILA